MLETIFNHTHFLIAYLDNDFNFVKVNQAYAEKHGKNVDFFNGKNHFDLYPNGDKTPFNGVLKTGVPYYAYSKPLDHPVLGISYWDWAIQPVKNESNEVEGLILSLTDVTDYKRNEDGIHEEQRKFIDEFIENRVSELMGAQESEQNQVNELKEKIKELEKVNKALKQKLESKNDDLDFEAFNVQITELKKSNQELEDIIAVKNPEIEKLTQQLIKLKKARNDSENILSDKLSEISALNQRITELENAADDDKDLILKKELEVEKLNEEIVELERSSIISSEALKSKNLEIEEINNDLNVLKNSLNEYKETISIKEVEIQNLINQIDELKTLKDDSSEIISVELQQIELLNEEINKQQLITELTKRNEKLELELKNSTLNEDLLIQIDELIKANEELEKFAETATNELQEPLRAIKSFTNVLAKRYKGKGDKDTDEFIDYTLEAVERLHNKTIALLEYSRIESRGKEFKLTETSEILDYAISNVMASTKTNNVKITYDELPKIYADSGQLLKLFQNILDNAVKFSKPNESPEIHISLSKENNEYVFSVYDNGIGIEEKDHIKIFDIFKRLNPEKGYDGTGIGLSVCKKIVERHGGRIWVESEPEIGARFSFTIPFVDTAENDKEIEVLSDE